MPCPKGFRCPPECRCGKHSRTQFHNELISRGVKRAWAERRAADTRCPVCLSHGYCYVPDRCPRKEPHQ